MLYANSDNVLEAQVANNMPPVISAMNNEEKAMEYVRILLDAGADPSEVHSQNDSLRSGRFETMVRMSSLTYTRPFTRNLNITPPHSRRYFYLSSTAAHQEIAETNTTSTIDCFRPFRGPL